VCTFKVKGLGDTFLSSPSQLSGGKELFKIKRPPNFRPYEYFSFLERIRPKMSRFRENIDSLLGLPFVWILL